MDLTFILRLISKYKIPAAIHNDIVVNYHAHNPPLPQRPKLSDKDIALKFQYAARQVIKNIDK